MPLPTLSMYLCLNFLPGFALLNHWPKQHYSLSNKSNTYTERHHTPGSGEKLESLGMVWASPITHSAIIIFLTLDSILLSRESLTSWATEMTHQLTAEDPGVVFSTHIGWLRADCKFSSRRSSTLFWPLWVLHVGGTHTLKHRHMRERERDCPLLFQRRHTQQGSGMTGTLHI